MFFNLEYILIGKQKINAILGLHCISETFSPSSMLYTLIVESKELEAKPSNKNYLLDMTIEFKCLHPVNLKNTRRITKSSRL